MISTPLSRPWIWCWATPGATPPFVPTFAEVAEKNGVNLFQLIMTVSEKDRKAPSRELMESVAASL